jgi:hypothetical protein
MTMKNLIRVITTLTVTGFILASCEGPMGPAGANGANGADANETCKECHNPSVVDAVATQFEFSKHGYGEAAFEEAGNTSCGPCHESEGFKYVCKNNVPATFTLASGKYSNDYATLPANSYGELGCTTCHSSLHTTYERSDFKPLTTTAPVAMTMWKGTKTIDLTQDGSMSNLCVKCHQPRPLTTSTTLSDGNVVDYAALVSDPGAVYYDSAVGNAKPNKLVPSYRMHVHYGAVGAVFAGKGGIEYAGSLAYTNSTHTTAASCQDCHMTTMSGKTGGHTFNTAGNFNSCNTTGCHSSAITSKTTTYWTVPRDDIKNLLNTLAAKINAAGDGTDILHSDATESNLWAGLTDGNYDGYLDIYDPGSNPTGVWKNPAPSTSWTQQQKDYNNSLTKIFPTLKNIQLGAMINFQLCLREFSLGIHNYKYTKALLQNTIEAMTTAGS